MRLLFIYGPVASGKLTIARLVAQRAGLSLFHNHLIVDAVAAVFPFGSQEFVRLREHFWIETFSAAAKVGQSLVFTFAPEPTVAADFPARVSHLVEALGGEVIFVALDLASDEQERRLVDPSRMALGKLRSPQILRDLRNSMAACMQEMPQPAIRIDTGATTPEQAADAILQMMKRLK
ncbi:shikimate kinase [Sabulicella rubraurantiaca]|uniref:shikimate kinase n=1 Tax=Sabulicella rubraurantiaca TaxID=2811429 RepID=UPI001A96D316|nr:shikimate kinase [Sabulicella rubraurantiaca]